MGCRHLQGQPLQRQRSDSRHGGIRNQIADKFLTAIRLQATINVQIVSPNADSPEIHFVGNRALVGLKNNDSFNCLMRWKLQTNTHIIDGGNVSLKAGSTTYFPIPPDKPSAGVQYPSVNWLVSETLKDEVRTSRLILEPDFDIPPVEAGAGQAPQLPPKQIQIKVAQPPPTKEIVVTLRFSRFGSTTQELLNGFCMLLLLLVGSVASLFINSGIPNYKLWH